MSWLQNLTAGFVLRNLLTPEANPLKVIEVKTENFSDRIIHCREDAIVLYGPGPSNKEKYEIILHRPFTETIHQAYSLYRSSNHQEAERKFIVLKDKIPHLVTICREISSLAGIQKLCDALEEHPTWTLAHLCASFALCDCFMDATIQRFLDTPDDAGLLPIHVAIKSGNLRTVQMLIVVKASLELLDNEANTVFHFAAYTTKEIISALSDSSPKCLNNRNINGHTPLHVACLADKPECVKALLLAGADVNISASQSSVTQTATSTSTPPGYVGNFLHENPNKLHAQDMKFGGTPLHWSCSREVIETLVDMGCDINSLNFNGRTALHIMVLRNRLACVVALLSRQAKIDLGDNEGDTPLHLAVKTGNPAVVQVVEDAKGLVISIGRRIYTPTAYLTRTVVMVVELKLETQIKALIVFGADLTLANNAGASPRHMVPTDAAGDKILYLLHAVGAPRCPPNMQECTKGCQNKDEGYNGVPPPDPPCAETREVLDQMLLVAGMNVAATSGVRSKTKGGRVLCLDGGGIRGLVLVGMLLELEAVVGRPVIHCFDWVAGTSTGGILALTLAAGKTLKECLCLYFRMKEYAFVGGRPYPSEPLEGILKDALGTDTVMADIVSPKIIITGVLADRKPVDLHLFRNYESPKELLRVPSSGMFKPPLPPAETLLWRAARASGAAPSYFRAFGRFLDGGLVANNPTLDALTEIHEYNLALQACERMAEVCPPKVVVSLGTGLVPLTQLKAIDVFRPESIWDTARLYMGVTALGTLLVDQATASDGRVVDRARAWCSMIGVPYYRFSPQMSEDIVMDEKSDEKLVNMLWEAKSYMHSNVVQLTELAMFLNDDC